MIQINLFFNLVSDLFFDKKADVDQKNVLINMGNRKGIPSFCKQVVFFLFSLKIHFNQCYINDLFLFNSTNGMLRKLIKKSLHESTIH